MFETPTSFWNVWNLFPRRREPNIRCPVKIWEFLWTVSLFWWKMIRLSFFEIQKISMWVRINSMQRESSTVTTCIKWNVSNAKIRSAMGRSVKLTGLSDLKLLIILESQLLQKLLYFSNSTNSRLTFSHRYHVCFHSD